MSENLPPFTPEKSVRLVPLSKYLGAFGMALVHPHEDVIMGQGTLVHIDPDGYQVEVVQNSGAGAKSESFLVLPNLADVGEYS